MPSPSAAATAPASLPQTRTAQMLSGHPLRLILAMASPNALAFLVQGSVSMTEVWYVGQLGVRSLAAMALMFPALMLMQMLANGAIGGAVTSAVARALGAGAVQRAEALVWHALLIALTAGAAFWLLWLLGGEALLRWTDVPAAVRAEAIRYGNVLFAGCVFIWLMGLLAAVFRGMGNMRFPAGVMMVGAAVQILLSGALILGWFGLPAWGLVGAAISTVCVMTLATTLLLGRLLLGNIVVKLRPAALRLSRQLFADIFRVGALAALSPVLTVLTIMVVNAVIGGFGAAELAGYGIAARLEFLLIPLVFGIGAAMTALVGTNIGAGHIARAEKIAWTGGAVAALLTGTVGLVLAVWPQLWVGLFTEDPATFAAGAAFLRIVGPVFMFQGLGLALYFASQGAGTVLWPVLAGLLRFAIAVGGAALGVAWLGWGLEPVYGCIAAGMVAFGTITAAAVALGVWRRQA